MPRFKDYNWDIPEGTKPGAATSWEVVPIAVLMDIRDELKILNAVISHKLDRISKNTAKPKRRKRNALLP